MSKKRNKWSFIKENGWKHLPIGISLSPQGRFGLTCPHPYKTDMLWAVPLKAKKGKTPSDREIQLAISNLIQGIYFDTQCKKEK